MEDDGSCEYSYDCAGICGGSFIEDACGNCYNPNAIIEFETNTFNYSGSIETYIVPDNVTSLYIEAYGAQGGNSQDTWTRQLGTTSSPGLNPEEGIIEGLNFIKGRMPI